MWNMCVCIYDGKECRNHRAMARHFPASRSDNLDCTNPLADHKNSFAAKPRRLLSYVNAKVAIAPRRNRALSYPSLIALYPPPVPRFLVFQHASLHGYDYIFFLCQTWTKYHLCISTARGNRVAWKDNVLSVLVGSGRHFFFCCDDR